MRSSPSRGRPRGPNCNRATGRPAAPVAPAVPAAAATTTATMAEALVVVPAEAAAPVAEAPVAAVALAAVALVVVPAEALAAVALVVVAAPALAAPALAAVAPAVSRTSRTTWTAESGRRANHPIVGSGRGPRAVGRSWRRPRVAHRTRGRRPVVFRGGGPLR